MSSSNVLHVPFGRHALFALGPNKVIDAAKHSTHKKASSIIILIIFYEHLMSIITVIMLKSFSEVGQSNFFYEAELFNLIVSICCAFTVMTFLFLFRQSISIKHIKHINKL